MTRIDFDKTEETLKYITDYYKSKYEAIKNEFKQAAQRTQKDGDELSLELIKEYERIGRNYLVILTLYKQFLKDDLNPSQNFSSFQATQKTNDEDDFGRIFRPNNDK